MVCSSVAPGGLPDEVKPMRRRRETELETVLPGGLAVEPSPREVRSSRRLEEGPSPTHNRLIAPATRKY